MNPIEVYKHEDSRRILMEWVKDFPIKSIKAILVKDKLPLGNHYHKNKDEIFFMLKGKGVLTTKGIHKDARVSRDWLFEGDCVIINRNTIHSFEVLKDSILLEAATEPYKPEDEIPATI